MDVVNCSLHIENKGGANRGRSSAYATMARLTSADQDQDSFSGPDEAAGEQDINTRFTPEEKHKLFLIFCYPRLCNELVENSTEWWIVMKLATDIISPCVKQCFRHALMFALRTNLFEQYKQIKKISFF